MEEFSGTGRRFSYHGIKCLWHLAKVYSSRHWLPPFSQWASFMCWHLQGWMKVVLTEEYEKPFGSCTCSSVWWCADDFWSQGSYGWHSCLSTTSQNKVWQCYSKTKYCSFHAVKRAKYTWIITFLDENLRSNVFFLAHNSTEAKAASSCDSDNTNSRINKTYNKIKNQL